jgi:hypothetical protein
MIQEESLPILYWFNEKHAVFINAVNRESAKRLQGQYLAG